MSKDFWESAWWIDQMKLMDNKVGPIVVARRLSPSDKQTPCTGCVIVTGRATIMRPVFRAAGCMAAFLPCKFPTC